MRKFLKSKIIYSLIKRISLKYVFTCCISFTFLICCTSLKPYGKYQKRWAYTHPIAALKLKKIKKKCDVVYSEVKKNNSLDQYENGGKLDAFRHIFYMATFSTKVNSKKLRTFGIAHEKDNYLFFLKKINEDGELADSLSSVMDLLNNEIGLQLLKPIIKITSENRIKDLCIERIQNGNAYFMKRNSIGNYLTCDGEIIDMKSFKGKWSIPKCLIQK